MLILLWVLGMAMSFYMTSIIYRKAELGRVLIVSQGFYYFFYIVASGLMIWINHFNLLRGVLGVLLIELAVVAVLGLKQKSIRPGHISLSFEKYLPLAILLLAAAFLVHEKAGIYGTGQDQGLYQIRAMMYMGGYNDNIIDFPEYYTIENNWEKEFYRQEIADMEGFYRLQKDELENANDVNGVLHGIATFPALLGLWGSMFGLRHMPDILTILYLLTIANVWLIGDNLKFKPWVSMLMGVYTAVCPIIVWCAKQTLTELGFTLIICAFLELLTEDSRKKVYFWSVIPLVAACYYHVILTVLIPLFVILYLINYLQTKRRGFLAALAVLMVGYPTGFSMMMRSALHYTLKNFDQLFQKTGELLNRKNVEAVVWIASGAVLLLVILLWQKKIRKALFVKWDRIRDSKTAKQILTWTLRGVLCLLILFFIYKGIKAYRMNMWPMKLSILGYFFMTGYIMLPAMILGIWKKAGTALRNRNILTAIISSFYVMFVYCGILWVLIYYYYYYARYLAPFIILVLMLAGYCLNRLKWQVTIPVCAVMAGLMIWQSRMLYTDQDLTYLSYQQMEDIVAALQADQKESDDSALEQKDVILIYDQGYHLPRMFALALKGLTGADLLFLNYDRLAGQMMECRAMYDDIYVLEYDLDRLSDKSGEWTYLYRERMYSSLYDTFVDEGLPYAKQAITIENPAIALLKYNQ